MLNRAVSLIAIVAFAATASLAQSGGTLQGTVTLQGKGTPLHQVSIRIVQLKRGIETDAKGQYRLSNVPPGRYTVLAHLDRFPDLVENIEIKSGETFQLDFVMSVATVSEEVTVTATGTEESVFESFQSITTLDSAELLAEANPSIGEALENESGVSKRSFGPGSSRPVIRGFDGDRVLVLEDGVRTGSLGSQSGDHGETVNVLSLERVEVVKGPATLLYGSNAIGGVVNAVTGHNQMHYDPHAGLRGFFTGVGGSTNDLGGVAGGVEYGRNNLLFWFNGGAQRTGDYDTPIGPVPNSAARNRNATLGAGYFGPRSFFSGSYAVESARYGVPFAGLFHGRHEEESATGHAGEEEPAAEEVDLALRKHQLRVNGGLRELDAPITSARLSLTYSDYEHRELEGEVIGTEFFNNQFTYRADFDQRPVGRLTGQFGLWGMRRDYDVVGDEALSPPVLHNAFAAFILEQVELDRVRFQFGARIERNAYDVRVDKPDRTFTGFSGAAGVRVNLWRGGAAVANVTRSHRAPALEELYNFGPHIGNLTFEVGNASLTDETSNGLDLSLRHHGDRLRAELNVFYYRIKDFVYLAPTGAVEDGLRVADYAQDTSRFVGGELNVNWQFHRWLALDLGLDAVDAELVATGTPLPRIPPLGGRAGLVFQWNGLTVNPELTFADRQDQLFPYETPTAGYGRFDVEASYTIAHEHVAHVISLNGFNLTDTLYRNHLSFIKDLAPEIGRGIRASYTLRFF